MNPKSIIFYGYDVNTYKDCAELINTTNRKHAELINIWFLGINVLYLIFCFFNLFGVNKSRIGFYSAFVVTALLFAAAIRIIAKRFNDRYIRIMVYINIIMLMSYSILDSNASSFSKASMFPVLLVLVALSYIDNMAFMSLALIISSTIFVLSAYSQKPVSIAQGDAYNAVVFLSLALVLHFTFQRARMSQFETYRKNIQIQHELEVTSSFDALTSLLNRGRFFSMAGQILRASHENEDIAVALLDLDGFKQINDTLGHQMGDKVIQMAGSTILSAMDIDQKEKWSFPERAVKDKLSFAGRLGGDEFIVFIRGRSTDEIRKVAEHMLSELNGVEFGDLHGIHASIGVTTITNSDFDIDRAYNRVDGGLYQSKREGKNRITFVD